MEKMLIVYRHLNAPSSLKLRVFTGKNTATDLISNGTTSIAKGCNLSHCVWWYGTKLLRHQWKK